LNFTGELKRVNKVKMKDEDGEQPEKDQG